MAALAMFLLAAGAALSHAQEDPATQAGRLSYLSGAVSVQLAGSNDWGQAYLNFPLGPGDRIYTDADGRAEIQVGQNFLRIGPNTDITFVNATPEAISFGAAQGAIRVTSMGLWTGQVLNVSTPSGSATLTHPGQLRIDVLPGEGAAVFTSFSDDALVDGAGGLMQRIGNWQSLELIGSNPVETQWLQPAAPDDLDAWSQKRDRLLARADSYRYVSPEMPGASDLDAYGAWDPDSEYGAVWFPTNLPVGWAPYHNGHWINHDPWGWVWVEDEPWGYAPFHYGRWVSLRGHWGWIPGPREVHPVWSPALVVFAGGIRGGGAGLSVWFPLGPGEPYRPWYRCSPRYIDQVNISNIRESRRVHVERSYVNIVNVTNITYVNRTIGVTAMRNEDFAAGRPAHRVGVAVDAHQLDRIQVLDRPEPRPGLRPVFGAPPVRPVPVHGDRPVFIDNRGKLISSRPGVPPTEPPYQKPPVARPLPGRTVVAPPPGAVLHHPVQMPTNSDRREDRPQQQPMPGQQQFGRPGQNPGQPPMQRLNPNPTQPPAQNPRPSQTQPPAPNPGPQQPPIVRPNPGPARPPFARPNPNPGEPPTSRPNPAPAQPPAQNPRPGPAQPAPRPAQPTPAPGAQPGPRPATPPAAHPAPQQPAPKGDKDKKPL